MAIYDLFSKRGQVLPDMYQYDDISQRLRNQIAFILGIVCPDYFLCSEVYQPLCRERGMATVGNEKQHLLRLLSEGDATLVLDIIELAFRWLQEWLLLGDCEAEEEDELDEEVVNFEEVVTELNHRFRENGVGYEYNAQARQLIRIDSQVLHQEVIQPALHLLTDPKFQSANEEYLKAHKHYREGEYRACLTECCSAFESTLKVVLDEKGWAYKHEHTAKPLLDAYRAHVDLPGYLADPLLIVATLRNKLGAHGNGTQPEEVPEHLAKYALHATGSAIVLLVDAAKNVQ